MRKTIGIFTFLTLCASVGWPVITFNDGSDMTENVTYISKPTDVGGKGGIVLYFPDRDQDDVALSLDGATIQLEVRTRPYGNSGGDVWVSTSECVITELPGECRVVTGPTDIRLSVSGGGGSIRFTASGWRHQGVVAKMNRGSAIWLETGEGVDPSSFTPVITLANNEATFTRIDVGPGDISNTAIGPPGEDLLGIYWVIGGGGQMQFRNDTARMFYDGNLADSNAAGFQLSSGGASATFATLRPARNSPDGIGRASTTPTGLTFIVSGEIMRITSTGAVITDGLLIGVPEDTTPPFSCTGANKNKLYGDDTSLTCVCDGSGWVSLIDGSACS